MVINVYSGFQKKINSTKQPTGGRSVTVHLKDDCSVLNPVFLLTGYNLSDNYVQWGSRYYFIDDIVITGNELAEYHCSTDVLATYKSAIGASSQYVLRSASAVDGSVTDSFYPMTAAKNYAKSSAYAGFVMPELGCFVFGIQGKSNSGSFGSTTYYCLDIYHAYDLMDKVFNASYSEYDAASVESASGLPEKVYQSIINPQQYIVSCMYMPFEYEAMVTGYQSSSSIMLGWYEFDTAAYIFNPSFSVLPEKHGTFTLPKHTQNSRGVYMNNSPFTEYVLSFMPFGDLSLPSDLLVNATSIYWKVIVDVITGQGTLKVYAGSDDSGQLLLSATAQIGVNIAVSGGVYDTSVGGMIGKAVRGGIIGSAIAGLTSKNWFSEVKDGIAEAELSPTVSTSGSNGALDFLEYPVVLYSRFTLVVDDDNTQHGRPLCKVRTISSLSGFLMCLKPDLDVAASRTEKEMIMSFLEGGMYYE